jgi:hypothetical protein
LRDLQSPYEILGGLEAHQMLECYGAKAD